MTKSAVGIAFCVIDFFGDFILTRQCSDDFSDQVCSCYCLLLN